MSEISSAYSRGYWAGSKGAFPKGKPPIPPDPILAEMITAFENLCNAVDGILATLEKGDEWEAKLGSPLDAGYEALEKYREWVREKD